MQNRNLFRYFKTSPEIIHLAVMMYVRRPLSLRNAEDLLHECSIDLSHETVRYWWNKFGPLFASKIRKNQIQSAQNYSNWRWHVDKVFVKINSELHYLWRAVDRVGEILEAYISMRHDRQTALKFIKKAIKRCGKPKTIVTDKLRSYRMAMKTIGNASKQETGHWVNNRAENSHLTYTTTRIHNATVQANTKFTEIRLNSLISLQPLQPRPPSHIMQQFQITTQRCSQ